MYTLAALLWAASYITTTAAPVPQGGDTGCDNVLPTGQFQLAAVPINANQSLIALTTTGGGSGLVIVPQPDDSFDGAANFTYNKDTQRLQTNGDPAGDTTYTSLGLADSEELSFSPDAQDGTANLGYVADQACDGMPYFIKNDESSVGLYGWTLCNEGGAGWVGTSSAEPCEKIALKVFINTTATTS